MSSLIKTAVFGIVFGYLCIFAGYYGADGQVCQRRGYDGHAMDFPLDGMCYYDSGTARFYVPIEEVIRKNLHAPKHRDEEGWITR